MKGQFLAIYRPNGKRRFTVTDTTRQAWLARNRRASATRKANGWKPSAAARAKISLAQCKAMAAGKYKCVSHLENRVATYVAGWGIPFVRQFRFSDVDGRGFVADFWFPSIATILEVNGTFWHADPRVYPAPRHAIQNARIVKDQAKKSFCEARRINFVVVWELDFNADAATEMQRALNDVRGDLKVTYGAAS